MKMRKVIREDAKPEEQFSDELNLHVPLNLFITLLKRVSSLK